MINYPGGINKKPYQEKKRRIVSKNSAANRGMSLEDSINQSNEFYAEMDRALILKRPTPINVVKVDYSRGALIKEAYFEKQSTTDYNGIYKGKYIDFEAKSTHLKTSFPLNNITSHQIEHLKGVIRHGGIAFFIIEFEIQQQAFLIDAQYVITFINENKRKSIPYLDIVNNGIEIKKSYRPALLYLDAVDKMYFDKII